MVMGKHSTQGGREMGRDSAIGRWEGTATERGSEMRTEEG